MSSITKTLEKIEDLQNRIEIMKAFANGEQIQEYVKWIGWRDTNDPMWDWKESSYRIKPEFDPIPATPEEIWEIESVIFIKPIDGDEGGIHVTWEDFYKTRESKLGHYIYDKDTKCWKVWQ